MESEEYRKHYEVERHHWWFQGMQGVYGALLQRIVPPDRKGEPLRILDLGCGTGGTSRWLRQFGRVTPLDMSWEALEWAGKQVLTDRVQGAAEQLPFRSAAFDFVAGLGLIEHIKEDGVALQEMARVCRPGGWLLLLTSAYQFLWSHHDRANRHCRRYTADRLRRLVSNVAWEPCYISYVNTLLFPAVAAIRVAQRVTGWDRWQTASDLARPDPFVNAICRRLLLAEAWWLRQGTLPFGVSLVCIAKRSVDV